MKSIVGRNIIFIFISLILLTFVSGCSKQNDAVKLHNTSPDSTAVGQPTDGDITNAGNTGIANTEEIGKEARYYPTSLLNFKTAYNENFDFWFDLPEDWKAFDRSENGDGYFIVTDNPLMDVRVYGMFRTGTDEDFYNSLTGKNGTIEDYTFSDGEKGKKILIAGSKVYFIHIDGDTYICFYVNFGKDKAWYESNAEKINSIAASLRTREEGPNLNTGENKITLDDLKLGEIVIDMPYKKVKEIMNKGILKEETDDLGGKTLFYDDNTEIYLINDSVYSMNVTSSDYLTSRGLKVGDDEAKVKELYGEPDNINDQTHWGYTIDGYELFSIVFKDGKVSELQISMTQ